MDELVSGIAESVGLEVPPAAVEEESKEPEKPKKSKTEKRSKEEKSQRKTKKKSKLKVQPKTVDEWIQARITDPARFGFSSEGNLVAAPVESGDTEKIIDLPTYYKASSKQIQDFIKNREEKIAEYKEQYSEARRALYRTHKEYKAGTASIDNVLTANKQTIEAEQNLISAAIVSRASKTLYPDPLLSDILLDQRRTEKKVPISVSAVERTLYPWNLFITTTDPATLADHADPANPTEPAKKKLNSAQIGAIIARRKKIAK